MKLRVTIDRDKVDEVFGISGKAAQTEWARTWCVQTLRESALTTEGAVVSIRRDGA